MSSSAFGVPPSIACVSLASDADVGGGADAADQAAAGGARERVGIVSGSARTSIRWPVLGVWLVLNRHRSPPSALRQASGSTVAHVRATSTLSRRIAAIPAPRPAAAPPTWVDERLLARCEHADVTGGVDGGGEPTSASTEVTISWRRSPRRHRRATRPLAPPARACATTG